MVVKEQADIGTSTARDLRKRNIEPPYILRRVDVREVNTPRSDFGRINASGDASDCFGLIHNAYSATDRRIVRGHRNLITLLPFEVTNFGPSPLKLTKVEVKEVLA